jgi:hypothetical protein
VEEERLPTPAVYTGSRPGRPLRTIIPLRQLAMDTTSSEAVVIPAALKEPFTTSRTRPTRGELPNDKNCDHPCNCRQKEKHL